MRKEKLVEKFISIKAAYNLIKANHSQSFEWFPVKTKAGCLIEMGGRNYNGIDVKIYVPNYTKDGEPKCYENGMVYTNYGVCFNNGEGDPWCSIEYSAFTKTGKWWKTVNIFVDFINNRNWVNDPIILDPIEVKAISWETDYNINIK